MLSILQGYLAVRKERDAIEIRRFYRPGAKGVANIEYAISAGSPHVSVANVPSEFHRCRLPRASGLRCESLARHDQMLQCGS